MKIGMVIVVLLIVVFFIASSLSPGWGSRIFETDKTKQEKNKPQSNDGF